MNKNERRKREFGRHGLRMRCKISCIFKTGLNVRYFFFFFWFRLFSVVSRFLHLTQWDGEYMAQITLIWKGWKTSIENAKTPQIWFRKNPSSGNHVDQFTIDFCRSTFFICTKRPRWRARKIMISQALKPKSLFSSNFFFSKTNENDFCFIHFLKSADIIVMESEL